MEKVSLRDLMMSDLDTIFLFEKDPEANYMAAFTAEDPTDRNAFDDHWKKITSDSTIIIKIILYEEKIAGTILKYEMESEPQLSYWVGREFWGKGVATKAARLFLDGVFVERPFFARIAKDNVGSRRVLEKVGFVLTGQDKFYANARKAEIDELCFTLHS